MERWLMETPDTIRSYWFGTSHDDSVVAEQRSKLWWSKDPQADHEIRQRFEEYVVRAAAGELAAWLATATGRLALILLTDQFTRNIYRDTSKAFERDGLARGWCLEGLQDGVDELLRPIERVFFYLPLEHSESLPDQDRSVALYQQLADSVDPKLGPMFDGYVEYAVRHREIIERFGRFPHRNQILGRVSSAEETAFLEEPGSSF
jgi:uncharacterized protein (DUF924 family)